jgi:hypothetical protein
MLVTKGFGSKWISWVMTLVKGGSISIRINDENGPYFKLGKGLRQEGPLSPFLFNLAMDVFSRILLKASSKGINTGLMRRMHPEDVMSLQYIYDTLLFLTHDTQATCYLKWVMVYFEKI